MNIMLFRGGMCGDLLCILLDPTMFKRRILSVNDDDDIVLGQIIKPQRARLKKFWRFSTVEKISYVNRLAAFPGIFLSSHDTDLSMTHFPNETQQVICSDLRLLHNFSRRFADLHRNRVIQEAAKAINSKGDFIDDYEASIKLWQDAFDLPNKIDIARIYHKDFTDYLSDKFPKMDVSRARELHGRWLISESRNGYGI